MPNYSWKGRTRAGRVQEGVLVAESKDAAIAALRKQQIIVTAVTEKGKEFALPKLGGRISSKEIAIRQTWDGLVAHPLFTPSGFLRFVTEVSGRFWRGEVHWQGKMMQHAQVDTLLLVATIREQTEHRSPGLQTPDLTVPVGAHQERRVVTRVEETQPPG